jgi:two-component system sensor histidine kinase UhpB
MGCAETRENPRFLLLALVFVSLGAAAQPGVGPPQTIRIGLDNHHASYLAYAGYAALAVLLLIALLAGWNHTLRKRIVQRTAALAENEQRFRRIADEDRVRLIIDTIPTMAWSVRPDGIVDFLNQRWVDYTGLSLEQYIQEPTGPIHPADIPRVIEKWLVHMGVGEPYDIEMRLRRVDGEYRWFLIRTVPLLDGKGHIVKWYGTSTDIEDRKRAEEEVRTTSEQLRALSARLRSAREEEGIRIAREIHDELGGTLTSLRWELESIRKALCEPERALLTGDPREKLDAMLDMTARMVGTIRRIASDLRPAVLDVLGLEEAIEWQAQQFKERTGIAVHCETPQDDVVLNPDQSTAVFRIFQEALTNIRRHAGATRVDVSMLVEAGAFVLRVKDNGRGITEDERSGLLSIGLLGMRERAHVLGGEVDVVAIGGKGTTVTVRLPLHFPGPD